MAATLYSKIATYGTMGFVAGQWLHEPPAPGGEVPYPQKIDRVRQDRMYSGLAGAIIPARYNRKPCNNENR